MLVFKHAAPHPSRSCVVFFSPDLSIPECHMLAYPGSWVCLPQQMSCCPDATSSEYENTAACGFHSTEAFRSNGHCL